MTKVFVKVYFAAILLMASAANAASFQFGGNITYHNDVVRINFSLANDATNVRVWTDSFQNFTNFDPVTALWNATTGNLIAENDDNSSIGSGQTVYDSGFSLSSLAAGDYFFTVATYNNFALGSNISEGFRFDGTAPILISEWSQPANSRNLRGTYWHVNLDGVDSASNPTNPSAVPVPAAVWLFGSAVTGLFGIGRKKRA